MAILRYIGRKYKLDGADEVEYGRIAMLEQQLQDNRMEFRSIAYNPEMFAKHKETFVREQLFASTELLSKFLGTNHFAVGNNLTYVDFMLYEYTVHLKVLTPELLAKFHNLKQFLDRLETLPQLQDYLQTRKPKTVNGVRAIWNAEY